MTRDEFLSLLRGSRREVFRLETRPQYVVPGEAERFAAWRAGQPLPVATADTSEWLAGIRADVAAGKRWYRVHILDCPLTEYLRYELYSYTGSHAAGFDTFLVDRTTSAELDGLREDFWLLDDNVGVRMVYDDDGRFICREMVDDVSTYRSARDAACRHAERLDDYLARTQPRLTV